jgi:hypothetical protein
MGLRLQLTSLLPLLAAGTTVAGLQAHPAVEAGPLVHDFRLTFGPGTRTEAAGPLLWTETTPSLSGWGLNPFVSFRSEPDVERTQIEFLYPLVTYDRYGTQYRLQLLQLLSWSGGTGTDDSDTRRFTLFPFYFRQDSTDPAKRYQALIPIYGTLQNRLFRDEIRFVAMPVWVQTRKRDVVTDNWLFPFFHIRHGAAHGWQLWPLYGQESRVPFTRTSAITDLPEVVPGHEKRFVLWPFGLSERTGLGSENPTTNRAVLPLFALRRSPLLDNTTVLWPFFTHTVNRENAYDEWGAPWPFVGWANGEGKHARRFWPLYGKASNTNVSSGFILWPAYSHKALVTENLERNQTRGFFYVWSDVSEKNRQTGEEYRRRSLWPLAYHWKDREGRERFQMLAFAETAFPHNEAIARSWSPVWSLYRSEKNPKAGAASQSLLWNLWRRDVKPGETRTSFLFGVVKTEKTKDGRTWRWFWRTGGKEATPAQP